MAIEPAPPQNRRKRGGRAKILLSTPEGRLVMHNAVPDSATIESTTPSHSEGSSLECEPEPHGFSSQLTTEDALDKVTSMKLLSDLKSIMQADNLYCPECYLPLGIRNVREQNDQHTLINFAINLPYGQSQCLTIHREDIIKPMKLGS
jgi:tRNA pseudouridine32 synthase